MSEVNFGSDGDYSENAFILKVNSNLANELGNLCQRTLSMVFKNCGKAIPTDIGEFTSDDLALLKKAKALEATCSSHISEQSIQKYAQTLIEMVWDANKYIDEMAPWVLRKTDPDRMATVLYVICEVLRRVGILYQPIIPTSANQLLDALSIPADQRTFAHLTDEFMVSKGAAIAKPKGIFPRLEVPELVEA